MTTSNRLGITELASSQNDRAATVNEAIAKLELGATLFACAQVLLNTPPGSPVEGDTYIVGTSPTGAWAALSKRPVSYYNGGWTSLPVFEGMYADDASTGALYRYDGSTWNLFASGGGGGTPVTSDQVIGIVGDAFNATLAFDAGSPLTLGRAAISGIISIPANSNTASFAAGNIAVGYTATAFDAGTKTTGTFTPDPANGNLQRAINGGAHTLAPPSLGAGDAVSMVIQYTNNGSAGTITTSGFTKVSGDSLTTTNGHDFLFNITVINGFSRLNVEALQ